MNIGSLDNRVEIQRRTVEADPTTGMDVETWAKVATVFANVQDVMPSRAESVNRTMETSVNRTRLRIRYRSGIDSSMRFVVQYPEQRTLQIVGGPAQIGGRKAYLEFMCEQLSTNV